MITYHELIEIDELIFKGTCLGNERVDLSLEKNDFILELTEVLIGNMVKWNFDFTFYAKV